MGFHDSKGVYHAFRSLLQLSLNDFRIVDSNGDVGNIVANGGGFASDSAPVLRGASGLISQELSWVGSNSTAIAATVPLPDDFDDGEDVLVDLYVNSGTTDAATFTVATSWDAGSTVSDTATDGAKSATTHKITARISAADIPAGATDVTIMLTPAAHTTNAIQLTKVRATYVAKFI